MIKEFGADFREDTPVGDITTSMIRKMVDKISQFSYAHPVTCVRARVCANFYGRLCTSGGACKHTCVCVCVHACI